MISVNVLSFQFHWRSVCLYDFSQCTELASNCIGYGCACMISANVLNFQIHWSSVCLYDFSQRTELSNPLVKCMFVWFQPMYSASNSIGQRCVCMISANVLNFQIHWSRMCLYDFSQCTQLPIPLEKGVFVWFQPMYWTSKSIGQGCVCMISANVLSFQFHWRRGVFVSF